MQGQQPTIRQTDQSQILQQQQGNIIIKMNDVTPITSVGEHFLAICYAYLFFLREISNKSRISSIADN